MVIRYFSLLILVLLLGACTLGGNEIRPLYPPFLPPPPQGGPQEFQQGWKDGCDTGFGAHGTDVYRASFKFTQDPSLALNPAYYKAWKDGENFCRTYIYEYSIRSLDVYCSPDGLKNECGDTSEKSVPFFSNSTDNLGYGFIGGGGVDSVLGGAKTDGFLGSTANTGSIFGDW